MKKIFISKDEIQISAVAKSELENANKINALIKSVAEFLNKELTPEQIQELINHRLEFVKVEFMSTSQFPKLTLDFNLDAVGKKSEYKVIRGQMEALNLLSNFISIEDGKAVVLTKEIEERYTKYASTPKQLEAYKFAVELSNLINDNLDKPHIDKRSLLANIRNVIPLVKERNNKIEVNLEALTSYNLSK